MSFALVGTEGAVSVGTSGAALTPAWQADNPRNAGDLLILRVTGWNTGGTPATPATPTGWTSVITFAGLHESVGIFGLIATGGDAAPQVAAGTSTTWGASLMEWSGQASGTVASIVDRTASKDAASSPGSLAMGGTDAAAGDLIVYTMGDNASADTIAVTAANNWTDTNQNNNGAAGSTHYLQGRGVTTANSAADSITFTFNAASSNCAIAMATFKVSIPPPVRPFIPHGMGIGV